MERLSVRGLTPQLFVVVILPLTILLIAITFGAIHLHRQAMRSLVGERDERSARAAASTLKEQLNHRSAAVHGLALRAKDVSSPDNLHRILRDSDFLLRDFDAGLAFLSADGSVIASTGSQEFWAEIEIMGLAEFQSFMELERSASFFSFTHPQTGKPWLITASLVPRSGLIAMGAFSPQVLARSALDNVFNLGEEATAIVLDEQMRILYTTGTLPGGMDLSDMPGVKDALAGDSGATFLQVGSMEHVIAYSPVSPVGWALVIDEPWEAVASPLLRATENAPLVLIPVLVVAVIALWFGTTRIVKPLHLLEQKAAELGWGNYEAIEESVGGIAEIHRLQTELIHLAHQVSSAQQGLRGYIGAITMGQEEERRRLSRELHDDTLQALIALNQRVQLAYMALNGSQEVEDLGEIQELTEEAIQNVRRVTRALRPIYLEDLGLVAALEMLSREMEQSSNLSVEFEKNGIQRRLEGPEELALYRIVQEALSNVIRHAQATHARVNIHFMDRSVKVEITDNGLGFEVPESPSEFAPSGHFGFLGMYERAKLIGAHLEIDSAPGEGTQVVAELPLGSIQVD